MTPTTETWENAIRVDLHGADYNSDEGIAVRPYYRREHLKERESQTQAVPGEFPFVRGRGSQSWEQVEPQTEITADAIRVCDKSIYDPFANVLRATTEAIAAVIGGCDSLEVRPFRFSSHLAMNIQRLLQE